MRVSLIKEDVIKDLILPEKISGSYWLTDYNEDGVIENLVNIEATDSGWKVVSNDDIFCIVNDKKVSSIILKEYNFYSIKDRGEDKYIIIYCSPVNETRLSCYELNSLIDGVTIGNDQSNDIVFISDNLSNRHARISLVSLESKESASNNKLIIKDFDEKYKIKSSKWGIYVNNKRVKRQQILENGDVIFIMGLKIIVAKLENKYICYVNNPNDQVFVEKLDSIRRNITEEDFYEAPDDKEMSLYDVDDYFHKKPRFINKIVPLELNVDAPPAKENDQGMSLLLTIGPMLTMSMTSLVMGFAAINNVVNNGASWSSAMPSLVICGAMFGSMFLWPLLTKRYEKRRRKKNEKERQVKYSKYIDNKRKVIQNEVKRQSAILSMSFPTTLECQNIIANKETKLWERRIGDDDFLKVNLGLGNQDMKIHIKYPEDHFSLVEDNLKDIVNQLGSEPKMLNNVPIELSFIEHNIVGIIGENDTVSNYMSQLLVQVMAFHSYDNLKIVLLTNDKNSSNWDFLRVLPHTWSDDRSIRYFGATNGEHKEICYNLERVFMRRSEAVRDTDSSFDPRYLVITDSFKSVRNFEFIKKVLNEKDDLGFSLVILDDKVVNLPDQCQTFIDVSEGSGSLFKSLLNNQTINFKIDNNIYDYYNCARILSNIPIEIDKDKVGKLPDKVGFLQMYDVGKIEQLNIENRWSDNNPVLSLGAPVGFGRDGEKVILDLHEKYHGPHGLIAGMTGSGKSEFIITYILSMAINFHPYEVQFILIDYKGGGLAGAFENSNTGEKLPHLVGTITNLDSNEIKRSLASIESELKRRQRAFNKARDISGESTVDIYKYQKMYREKIVDEPVSHLFIICDEFAELKSDQPDFMDQLVSTARIGRSLGVHLILATQKPSGVVDPQIWSNTRFRVCLRVQDKSDSSEVIKCPDAAYLKQTGRFYFQVGFNEIFILGQAAWAGGQYIPSERIRKTIDTSLNFINDIGYVIKTSETRKKQKVVNSYGEELSNIVKYLSGLAINDGINCLPLWLAKIPGIIFITNLMNKYGYVKEQFVINPVIGEFDDPNRQQQHLLTLPLSSNGNAVVYGIAGSGKENFINTVVYSSMLCYSPDEVNFYILDFGAETLRNLKNSPLVGDVLTSDDDEKISNLFKMMYNIIDERKKMFVDYGGSYLSYVKATNNVVPAIVIVINNYESYQETYPAYDDDLIVLTRDCMKYGIYFVVTVTTPNGMRFKLKQNFNQTFVLGQNNEDDYVTILGNVKKTYPSKIFGRGIIKTDSVYEFQTAMVAQPDDIQNQIKIKCDELNALYQKSASSVPVLPEIVSYNDIASDLGNSNYLVIGLSKNTLRPVSYNYRKNFINIITTLDITLAYPLIEPLINELLYLKNNVVFINAEDYSLDSKYRNYINYEDSNFDKVFMDLESYIASKYSVYKTNNYNKNIFGDIANITVIIDGISSFMNKISDDNKAKFKDLCSMGKDLGIMNIIIIDSVDNIRKVEAEAWYKNSVNGNDGIWIGNGINEQFSLKVTQRTKELKEELPDNFCFVVNRGKPVLTKLVEEFELS